MLAPVLALEVIMARPLGDKSDLKDSVFRFKPYGMGMPIILVLIVVLCLLTFSVVSLMTARNSYRNEELSKKAFHEYQEAENEANEWVSEIQRKYADGNRDVLDYEVSRYDTKDGSEIIVMEKLFQINKKKDLYVEITVEVGLGKSILIDVMKWMTVNNEDVPTEQTVQGM